MIAQFNKLLSRQEYSFSREQRFSSDAAHESRIPVAELNSMAEVVHKWPDDIKLSKSFYTGILESSSQMQKLVNNLLTLARCEKGLIELEAGEIKLKTIIVNNHYAIEVINECYPYSFHLNQSGTTVTLDTFSPLPCVFWHSLKCH